MLLTKKNYKYLLKEVSNIVRSVDPLGLIGGGAPNDEHDSEILKILLQLSKIETIENPDQIRNIVNATFRHSFGEMFADVDKGKIDTIAKNIFNVLKAHKVE